MIGHVVGVEPLGMGHLDPAGAAPRDIDAVIADTDIGDETELRQAFQEVVAQRNLASMHDRPHPFGLPGGQLPTPRHLVASRLQRLLHGRQHLVRNQD